MFDDRIILHIDLLTNAIACFCFFFTVFWSRHSVLFQKMYNSASYLVNDGKFNQWWGNSEPQVFKNNLFSFQIFHSSGITQKAKPKFSIVIFNGISSNSSVSFCRRGQLRTATGGRTWRPCLVWREERRCLMQQKALPSETLSSKVNTQDYATYCLATKKGQV